jgi:hypothetical protein
MPNQNSADVIIVGTGVIGCLISEQMLDAGLSVLMLGPTSALVTLARIGVFVGVVALLLALIFSGLFIRKRMAAVCTNRMAARR